MRSERKERTPKFLGPQESSNIESAREKETWRGEKNRTARRFSEEGIRAEGETNYRGGNVNSQPHTKTKKPTQPVKKKNKSEGF